MVMMSKRESKKADIMARGIARQKVSMLVIVNKMVNEIVSEITRKYHVKWQVEWRHSGGQHPERNAKQNCN